MVIQDQQGAGDVGYMRNSCVIYDSWKEMIVSLPDEMAGELIKMILTYALDGEQLSTDNPGLKAMFNMISKKMDEDEAAWREECKRRSEAGKKGMANRWGKAIADDNRVITKDNTLITKGNSNKQTVTNITVSESESESESDTESESVTESVTESVKDKKHIYGEYRHVRLTDREMDRLVNDYGEQETHAAIKYLDEYKQRKPYKSKDDNLTLRKWVFDAVKEDKARGQPQETIFDAWAKA